MRTLLDRVFARLSRSLAPQTRFTVLSHAARLEHVRHGKSTSRRLQPLEVRLGQRQVREIRNPYTMN